MVETNMIKTAVLLLSTNIGKKIINDTPYHLTRIAGVPFMKRTILSLQKSGIEKLFIIRRHQNFKIEREIKHDERIKLDIKWIFTQEEPLISSLRDKIDEDTLVLNDNIIFDPQRLEKLLISEKYRINTGRIFVLAEEDIAVSEEAALTEIEVIKDSDDIIIEKITDKASVKKAEKKIFMSINNPTYGLLEKYIDRRISILLTKFFINTPATPNQITIVSTLIGLCSLWFFISPYKMDTIIGSCLFIVCIIVDCCDGEVARITFQESKYGSLLDIICDNVVQIPLFFAIAYGVYQGTHSNHILAIGLTAVIGSFLSFMLIFYNMRFNEKMSQDSSKYTLSPIEKREYNIGTYLNNFINRDFAYLILICAFLGKLDWFLTVAAIGSNILWIIVLIKKRRVFMYERV